MANPLEQCARGAGLVGGAGPRRREPRGGLRRRRRGARRAPSRSPANPSLAAPLTGRAAAPLPAPRPGPVRSGTAAATVEQAGGGRGRRCCCRCYEPTPEHDQPGEHRQLQPRRREIRLRPIRLATITISPLTTTPRTPMTMLHTRNWLRFFILYICTQVLLFFLSRGLWVGIGRCFGAFNSFFLIVLAIFQSWFLTLYFSTFAIFKIIVFIYLLLYHQCLQSTEIHLHEFYINLNSPVSPKIRFENILVGIRHLNFIVLSLSLHILLHT